MYSEEFMAYLAAYQKEERQKKEKNPADNIIVAIIKLFLKTA